MKCFLSLLLDFWLSYIYVSFSKSSLIFFIVIHGVSVLSLTVFVGML